MLEKACPCPSLIVLSMVRTEETGLLRQKTQVGVVRAARSWHVQWCARRSDRENPRQKRFIIKYDRVDCACENTHFAIVNNFRSAIGMDETAWLPSAQPHEASPRLGLVVRSRAAAHSGVRGLCHSATGACPAGFPHDFPRTERVFLRAQRGPMMVMN